MRTLHFGLHVADLERSLAFYTAVGYEVVGEVPETGLRHLTMLKLPDDEFVTIELVHEPNRVSPVATRSPRRHHGGRLARLSHHKRNVGPQGEGCTRVSPPSGPPP